MFSQILASPAESKLLSSILTQRGWQRELGFFFSDSLRLLHNPFLLHEMYEAVYRCQRAIKNREKIVIVSDYDLDGMASVVILLQGLQAYGLQPSWLHTDSRRNHFNDIQFLKDLKKEGSTLLFLLDGGSNLPLYSKCVGLDIIIFDHHVPSGSYPQCTAFVNPHLATYPYKEISSAVLTAKFLWALAFSFTPFFEKQSLFLFWYSNKDGKLLQYATSSDGVIKERGVTERADEQFYKKFNNMPIYYFGDKEQLQIAQNFAPQTQDLAQIFCSYYPQFDSLKLSDLRNEKTFPQTETPLDTLNLLHQEIIAQEFSLDKQYIKSLDLMALATLSDMMPLRNENRIVVKRGVQVLKTQLRSGLRQLFINEGLLSVNYDSLFLMRRVNPLLNAAGKLGKAHLSTSLLLTNEAQQARTYAKELKRLYKERRSFCRQIWLSLYTTAKESCLKFHKKMIVLYDERLHSGVSGLLALQLCRSFCVPVILAYADENDGISASIRSNTLLDIDVFFKKVATLGGCFGGHRYAGGFSLKRKEWSVFVQHCYRISQSLILEEIDTESGFKVNPELVSPAKLLEITEILAPFGYQNSPPLFVYSSLRVIGIKPFGKGSQHLNLMLEKGEQRWRVCWWNALTKNTLQINDRVNLSFHVQKNAEEQLRQPRVDVKDVQQLDR